MISLGFADDVLIFLLDAIDVIDCNTKALAIKITNIFLFLPSAQSIKFIRNDIMHNTKAWFEVMGILNEQ